MLNRSVSISLRLTLWFGAILFCGWIVSGLTMWLQLKHTLTEERHQTLSRRADRLDELLARDQGMSEADRLQDFKDFAHATGNGLVEVYNPGGTRVFPSPSSAAQSFPWPAIDAAHPERFLHVRSGDQFYWVLVHRFQFGGQPLCMMLAAPEAGNLVLLHSFWRGLLAWAPIVLVISSACGYWVSRRALQPVDRITATARSISISNLSQRLAVNDSGDELQRLAATFNEMLFRLESAVKKIKQFTADASHELRGPLSFTRTVAEVALRSAETDEMSRKAFRDIADEAAKAAVMLDQMLTLARADAEPFSVALEPISLSAVMEETCGQVRKVAQEKNLAVHVRYLPQEQLSILGDSASLRRLLWILLDNALKYTESPGQIDVSLFKDSESATLCVEDTGMGIAASDLPHIFDRFYRSDPSRSHVEGSGLGLAIAKWIAETHHAVISVVSEEGKGTTCTVVFPLLQP